LISPLWRLGKRENYISVTREQIGSLKTISRGWDIADIASRFKKREMALRQIAAMLGCSHETVRKQLMDYLGQDSYSEIVASRSEDSKSHVIQLLDIDRTRSLLQEQATVLRGGASREKALLADVLLQAKNSGISLTCHFKRERLFRFTLPRGSGVKIKVAVPSGNEPEHRHGLHRFRLNPSISSYDFAVFSARHGKSASTYIFPVSEICEQWSLVLRYKCLERGSKYKYARDRWSVLKEA
jgi:lambda repressor-like predicted transcriptional regulator